MSYFVSIILASLLNGRNKVILFYSIFRDTTSFGCMVNGEGEVTDYIRLPYLKNRTRTQREKEREEKVISFCI
jgi:hypothetical protein